MWYGRYLLNIGQMPTYEERLLPYLDENRRIAVQKRKGEARLQSLGAGLLLQKAVQDFEKERIPGEKWLENRSLVEDMLAELENWPPCKLKIAYSPKGKPYFTNIPLKFSLSHSGQYVLCVVCEEEVGADVQLQKASGYDKLPNRFFTKEEQELFAQCRDEAHRRALFYKMWTAKEAYGKLTGEGLSVSLQNEYYKDENVCWESYSFSENGEDYSIGICR